MNGVILNISTDEAATEFPRDGFEIDALIRCAPWFTVSPLPLHIAFSLICVWPSIWVFQKSLNSIFQIVLHCHMGDEQYIHRNIFLFFFLSFWWIPKCDLKTGQCLRSRLYMSLHCKMESQWICKATSGYVTTWPQVSPSTHAEHGS